MASSKPLLLLLGSGSNIGQAVAKKFLAGGYHVASAARSLTDRKISNQEWSYKADLSDTSAVEDLFAKVSKDIGIPNVVIYNAATLIISQDHPFSISVGDLENTLRINTLGTYAAAKCAVEGFDKLPKSARKSFMYTGNILNIDTIPMLFTLGVGKSASAHIIQTGASAYAEKGYRFYYVDQRLENGSSAGQALSGQGHADYYFELAAKTEQGPWNSTFVSGKGYVKFA